jgi:hypothetical protein
LNADNMVAGIAGGICSYNLYIYCLNNPVSLSDPSGQWPAWAVKLAAAVAVVVVVVVVAAVVVATCGAGSALAMVAVGAAKGAAIGFAVGAVTGAAAGAVGHRLTTGSWEGAGQAALNGMANGALSGAISGAITGGLQGWANYAGSLNAGIGYDSFQALKADLGSPGAGNQYHHIVEQCQIGRSGFSPQMVHNTNNVITMNTNTHRAVSAFYSSKARVAGGQVVRDWLVGQSFEAQYQFGLQVIDSVSNGLILFP